MSFGYAVGDVIAVLGLFERVAIELRNYKDAPAHFQQLGVELDLLRNTLQHVLRISPENDADRQTLERIRAIVIHCMQPLQEMANKMQSKESSLGHFRTTRSLSSVGTRLHWSMIAKGDVDEMRKIILSQMLAINTLLSVQQLSRLRESSTIIRSSEGAQSALVNKRCNALMDQTSKILNLVASTPAAIATIGTHAHENLNATRTVDQKLSVATNRLDVLSLQVKTASQAAQEHHFSIANATRTLLSLAHDIRSLFFLLSRYSKDMLEAIGRNTVMLLDIAAQMKRIIRAIEAIPLHLTLDIVRLDDALGESWALPFQACRTLDGFRDLLRNVVFANNRPGFNRLADNQYIIKFAGSASRCYFTRWESIVKPGMHLEQSILVSKLLPNEVACPYPGCNGTLSARRADQHEMKCSVCDRVANVEQAPVPLVQLNTPPPPSNKIIGPMLDRKETRGPKLSAFEIDSDLQYFRRVEIHNQIEPIVTLEVALEKLHSDPNHPAANAFLGFDKFQKGETDPERRRHLRHEAIEYLQIATRSISAPPDWWYLLGSAYLWTGDKLSAFHALQEAIYVGGSRFPAVWNLVACFYFTSDLFRDSLDAIAEAIKLDPYIPTVWNNLGVLYDICDQPQDAFDSFSRSLELDPGQTHVLRRVDELGPYRHITKGKTPGRYKLHTMSELAVQPALFEGSNDGIEIKISPLREGANPGDDSGNPVEASTMSSDYISDDGWETLDED